MTNPQYHIKKQGDANYDPARCTLTIQVDTNGLFLLILEEKKLTELRYYRLEYDDLEAMHEELEQIFRENFTDGTAFSKVTTILNWPDFSLVPAKYYSPETNREMLELVHGDLEKGTILSEAVSGYDMQNVYRVPSALHEYLLQRFPAAGIWHFNTLWLECAKADVQAHEEVVKVLIYPGYFLLLASRSGRILLTQRFVYETDDDVLFYVLSVFENLQLDKNAAEVSIAGFVFEDSSLLHSFRQFFSRLTLAGDASALPAEQPINQYPKHFFSPILNLGRCVS